MQRRSVLHLLGAVAAAGCTTRPSPATDDTPSEGSPTDDPTPAEDGTPSPTAAADGGPLAVTAVETFTHAVRLNDLGSSPRGSIPRVADLDDRPLAVVEAAVEGTYETSDLPDWLAQFLSRTPYVARNGEYYRLDASIPTYTITAEEVGEDEVDGEIASSETYREAVTHDGRRTTALLRHARRDGVTLGYVWPSLREFLDTYDAVRYRGSLLAVSVTVDDPGAPYTVTAERMDPTELTDRAVWDVSGAPEATRELVGEAGATGGVYAFDDPPAGFVERLRDSDYVYLDGTFYTAYVEKDGPLPVTPTAAFTDPALDGDGARFRLALHNDADAVVTVDSGAPPPFGVLRFHPAGDPDASHLLWTDAYEENDHVHTEGREVVAVNDIGLSTTVAPGEAAAREFVVDGSGLSPGEYVLADEVGVSVRGGDGGTFPYRVRFRYEDGG